MNLPNGFDKWNRALQGAYRKGYLAYTLGINLSDCPYADKRKDSGRLTWSRAFRTAWGDGWSDAKLEDRKVGG